MTFHGGQKLNKTSLNFIQYMHGLLLLCLLSQDRIYFFISYLQLKENGFSCF